MTMTENATGDLTHPEPTKPSSPDHRHDADENKSIVLPSNSVLTRTDEALLEFGKEIYKGSLPVSIDFHKTMLGLTATFSTLMTTLFALLVFGTNTQRIEQDVRLFLIVPISLMLLSSIAFAYGYYPRSFNLILNDLNSLESTRNKLIGSRRTTAVVGISLFILSIIALLGGVYYLNT